MANRHKIILLPMLPNIIPFSVEATLTLALMLAKSWGARVRGEGFSTNLRSPVGEIHLVKIDLKKIEENLYILTNKVEKNLT